MSGKVNEFDLPSDDVESVRAARVSVIPGDVAMAPVSTTFGDEDLGASGVTAAICSSSMAQKYIYA